MTTAKQKKGHFYEAKRGTLLTRLDNASRGKLIQIDVVCESDKMYDHARGRGYQPVLA